MNPKLDFYFTKTGKWREALKELRVLALECGLTEELKWGCPCYTFQDSNIVLIHSFKEYCALLFFKGALLRDVHRVLAQQTVNVQTARQLRFITREQVVSRQATVKEYILEAIEIERAGGYVGLKKTAQLPVPEEFQQKLAEMPRLKAAFEALTPGRQRSYLLYFAAAKQAKTRCARVEKQVAQILAGQGLQD